MENNKSPYQARRVGLQIGAAVGVGLGGVSPPEGCAFFENSYLNREISVTLDTYFSVNDKDEIID